MNIIKNSQSYKNQIGGGLEPSNDQGGYSLYKKEYLLQQPVQNETVPTVYRTFTPVCLKCRKGYGLSDDKKTCQRCPSSC